MKSDHEKSVVPEPRTQIDISDPQNTQYKYKHTCIKPYCKSSVLSESNPLNAASCISQIKLPDHTSSNMISGSVEQQQDGRGWLPLRSSLVSWPNPEKSAVGNTLHFLPDVTVLGSTIRMLSICRFSNPEANIEDCSRPSGLQLRTMPEVYISQTTRHTQHSAIRALGAMQSHATAE